MAFDELEQRCKRSATGHLQLELLLTYSVSRFVGGSAEFQMTKSLLVVKIYWWDCLTEGQQEVTQAIYRGVITYSRRKW